MCYSKQGLKTNPFSWFNKLLLMKRFYIILFLIFWKASMAQSNPTDTLNFTDANNLKQGKWLITNLIKKLPGYKEDQLVEEGRYADSKKTGIWKKYFPNGKAENELTFVNNRPNGYAKFYYDNGNVREEGMWENNRWTGTYKMFYEDGTPNYDWSYNGQGKREGNQKYFHPNGKLMIEGDWKEGKESGILKEYYANGTLKSEKNFADGKLDETSVKHYEDKGGPAPTAKETPKKEEPKKEEPKKEEPKKEVPIVVSEGVGIIKDGFNKLYNKSKQVEKEGEFKDGKMIDGKIYYYDGTKLVKTGIVREGKIAEYKVEK